MRCLSTIWIIVEINIDYKRKQSLTIEAKKVQSIMQNIKYYRSQLHSIKSDIRLSFKKVKLYCCACPFRFRIHFQFINNSETKRFFQINPVHARLNWSHKIRVKPISSSNFQSVYICMRFRLWLVIRNCVVNVVHLFRFCLEKNKK